MKSFSNYLHCSGYKIVSLTFLSLFPTLVFSLQSLTPSQHLTPNQTLVSPSQIFELGFFSLSDSRWYLGIWYKNIPPRTYAWVANRDTPLANSPEILKIGDDNETIVLLDRAGNKVWWSKFQTLAANPTLQLLDTGNLVVYEANEASTSPTNFIWQSFDYPTDTLLPGMTLGWNLDTGRERYISSWKSQSDPGTGDYAFKLNFHGFPEVFLWDREDKIYRSGPWNGMRFSGVPEMQPTDNGINFSFITNSHEVYYTFSVPNKFWFSRLIVNSSGYLQRYTWIDISKTWNLFWYAPKDQCDQYRECGPFGLCDTNASPVCKCMKGFSPKNLQAWNLRDGSDGCVRNTRLDCETDKFLLVNGIKLPESTTAFVDKSMKLDDCRSFCLRNCSCTAYSSADIANPVTGCVMWSGELFDIRQYAEGGQDVYVRLAASEIDNAGSQIGGDNHQIKIVGIVAAVSSAVIVASISICLLWKRRTSHRLRTRNRDQRGLPERSQEFLLNEVVISRRREFSGERNQDELELPLFDFNTIAMATNKFSEENKLGQGGFGSVYRGILVGGPEIAVKRLSQKSTQGTEEFKNEVRLIVRLQHRNLVRLLGCCIEMDEKMLVYEYMENRSLDGILFDKAKRSLLNWPKRFNIICGIARGLLYLHQDSSIRIIHRDLKASNILLDGDLNPKISDFGMARIFGTDQTEANTKRVVGTYGYMSPEYAMDGLFSVKSDVFSFGVLVLEIISGKKNRGFYYENNELNLLGLAWTLWIEGKGLELFDASGGETCSPSEILRCIQIGLLCVQERAEDRPTMSSVVLMLSSETANVAQPKNPGFSMGRNPLESNSSSSKQDESCTANQLTVTMLSGR